MVTCKIFENNQPIFDGLFHKMEPCFGNQDPEIRCPKELGYYQILLCYKERKVAIKWLLLTFYYIHRSLPCSKKLHIAAARNKQTHSQSLWRGWKTLEYSAQNSVPQISLHRTWGTQKKRRQKERKNGKSRGDGRHPGISIWSMHV